MPMLDPAMTAARAAVRTFLFMAISFVPEP
jgi:hypothetical protein